MAKKYDFNVPLIGSDGEVMMQPKYDRTKLKPTPDGRAVAETVVVDGYIVQEPVMLREMLFPCVDQVYQGEEGVAYSERNLRGKVARKVNDKSSGSLKNYTKEELDVISACLVKGNAKPSTIEQFESITENPVTGGDTVTPTTPPADAAEAPAA